MNPFESCWDLGAANTSDRCWSWKGLSVSGLQPGCARVSLAGGEVVLARDHLVFSPWDMDKTRAFLVQWLSKAGVPHVGTADKLLTASKLLEPVVLPVADIERGDAESGFGV